MDISTFRDLVGEDAWSHGKSLVRAAYPDPRCNFGDGLVARVICALPREAQLAIGATKVTADIVADVLNETQETIAGAEDGIEVSYFIAMATHTRRGVGAHSFTGELPMVRVRLPDAGNANIRTEFGIIYGGDHKLSSVAAFTAKYKDVLDFEVGKLYVTTPARYLGARFAAVATYEVYDTAGKLRSWTLEAGMATGESMVLFHSPDTQPIDRKSWYAPTPFSQGGEHWYRGAAAFVAGSDAAGSGPTSLRVDVCTTEELAAETPHVTVSVTYAFVEGTSNLRIFPSKLTAQAGLRVAAIAVARGTDNKLFKMLAPFGRALPWNKEPTS